MAQGKLIVRRWWSVWLLACLLLPLVQQRVGGVNDGSRLALIESLLSRGETHIEESPFFDTTDAVFVNGHFYSDKPPLLSLYSTLVVAPLKVLIAWESPLLYIFLVISSSGLALVLLLWCLSRLVELLGVSAPASRWTAYALVLATPLLPFWLTYNSHVLEASLALATMWLLLRHRQTRRTSLAGLIGIPIALLVHLHPLTGIVFAVAVTGYFLVTSGDDGWRYIGVACLVTALGFGAHYILYGKFLPFYFQPTLYLYGPSRMYDIPMSSWLGIPAQPGLTVENITARFQELGLSDELLNETLTAFGQYQEHQRNPVVFAWNRWRQYDVLTFTPLVIMALWLVWQQMWNRQEKDRVLYVWILAVTFGLYLATTTLRAVPGASFGNRHLLPVLPLIIVGAARALNSRQNLCMFKVMFWISFAMMLPGTLAPWRAPQPSFLAVNQLLWGLAVAMLAGYFGLPPVRRKLQRIWQLSRHHTVIVTILVCLGTIAELLWHAYPKLLFELASHAPIYALGAIMYFAVYRRNQELIFREQVGKH